MQYCNHINFSKLTYKLNLLSIKPQTETFSKYEKLILRCKLKIIITISKNRLEILKKYYGMGVLILPDTIYYYKATVFCTVWNRHRLIAEQIRIQN